MKRESREIVKLLAVGLAVMMALPLAYRVWVHCHPQPDVPPRSLMQFLSRATEVRALQLLQTPLPKWTDYDRKTEPHIRAWLEAHARQVLPWEWSDEARRKDPDGYRKLWRGLFEEQREALNRRLKTEREALKALERKLWLAERLQASQANWFSRAVSSVATNAFGLKLGVEDLTAQAKAARDRVAVLDDFIARNEAILDHEEVKEALFLSETCRFLRSEVSSSD